MALTKTHGVETKIEDNETFAMAAEDLHVKTSLFATEWVVKEILKYVAENKKKIPFVVSYPASSIAEYIETGERWDQPFVDYLKKQNIPFVDLTEEHRKDFEKYKVGMKEYLSQYYVGHYNPRGNCFCAFAIKDALVNIMELKPLPYK